MAKIVCAGFVGNGKILLVRRASHRKWSANLWDLVGGHVEKGEGLDEALVRECEEEVGLTPLAFNKVATLYERRTRDRQSISTSVLAALCRPKQAILIHSLARFPHEGVSGDLYMSRKQIPWRRGVE